MGAEVIRARRADVEKLIKILVANSEICELGGQLPNDRKAFHDQAGCAAAKLPDPPTNGKIFSLYF